MNSNLGAGAAEEKFFGGYDLCNAISFSLIFRHMTILLRLRVRPFDSPPEV